MAKFKKGNKAAEGKNIETPQKLWELFLEFKTAKKSNPRYIYQLNQRTGDVIPIPHTPPLTWESFDCFLSDKEVITTLQDYKANRDDRYKAYVDIITRIKNEIYSDKFEGAAVRQYDSNIIARDLGLKDKQETEVKIKEIPDAVELAKSLFKE